RDAPDVKPGDHHCRTSGLTCTLRAAIQEADATGGVDNVIVPPGRYRLSSVPSPEPGAAGERDAGNGDLDITEDLTVRGAGAAQTTVDGAGLDRVFEIASDTTALISDMTITGGDADGGDTSAEIGLGGGVLNQGTAILERLRLVHDKADGGGGVFTIPGTHLTIHDSLIADNAAYEGGGVRIDSGAEIVNTTITRNVLLEPPTDYVEHPKALTVPTVDEISGWGGGIDHRGGDDVAIVNSTITDNHALKGGGGLNSGQGYAPVSDKVALGRVRLRNSIIARNTSAAGPRNCHVKAQVIESTGNNLDSDDSCFLSAEGDLSGRDPLLAPLADNGGPTETQALLPGSPAIDAGAADGCPQHDQRGTARPQGAGCDIGAFERARRRQAPRKRSRAQHRRHSARHKRKR
ncbi:MAG TPA: choice-of-anchor Q domain-containing protein, partial [Solirubrobacteraceae bacterium]